MADKHYLCGINTWKRETEAIAQAAKALRCHDLTIVCMDPSRDAEVAGQSIKVRNAAEWLCGL